MQELKDDIPQLIRSAEQLYYYIWIVDACTDNGVPIKAQDAMAIATFAINLALLDECAESISKDGMMMKMQGDRGTHNIGKVNPAVALQKEAQTALRFYFKEFQMSPSSRGNNGTHIPNPRSGKDDGFDDV